MPGDQENILLTPNGYAFYLDVEAPTTEKKGAKYFASKPMEQKERKRRGLLGAPVTPSVEKASEGKELSDEHSRFE
jgi:hypothetical protein